MWNGSGKPSASFPCWSYDDGKWSVCGRPNDAWKHGVSWWQKCYVYEMLNDDEQPYLFYTINIEIIKISAGKNIIF
jgi:hypothetical protein